MSKKRYRKPRWDRSVREAPCQKSNWGGVTRGGITRHNNIGRTGIKNEKVLNQVKNMAKRLGVPFDEEEGFKVVGKEIEKPSAE